jgi:hypothetical protein
MLDDMAGAAQLILEQGAEYIDIRGVETEASGYTREFRIIVEKKAEEGEHEHIDHSNKVRHPAYSDS